MCLDESHPWGSDEVCRAEVLHCAEVFTVRKTCKSGQRLDYTISMTACLRCLPLIITAQTQRQPPKKAPGNLIPGREETLMMGRNTQRDGAVRGLTFPPNKALLSRWAGACELSSRSVSMHRDRDVQTRNYPWRRSWHQLVSHLNIQ